jgi:hypothetical protein
MGSKGSGLIHEGSKVVWRYFVDFVDLEKYLSGCPSFDLRSSNFSKSGCKADVCWLHTPGHASGIDINFRYL